MTIKWEYYIKINHFGTVCSGNWQYETMMGVLIVRHESSLQEGIFGSKWDDRFLPPSFFPSPKPQFKAHFRVKLFLNSLVKTLNFTMMQPPFHKIKLTMD